MPHRRQLELRLPNGGLMSDHPTPLGGNCSGRFEPLRELFASKLESGEDLGASLAVNNDGEMVVDLRGGWADEACTVPWTEQTLYERACTTMMPTKLKSLAAALVLGVIAAGAIVSAQPPGGGGAGPSQPEMKASRPPRAVEAGAARRRSPSTTVELT
jgi:hypothetical protein